ncbi:MAG: HAMP domain-containing histidine kinase [Candidatus Omnitrophica bacterium]|nr:HAMP domain-containing histidine kinase [Candidatus Omnitrophota bacterium]MBU1869478.1 HAMP domain-containing histidine kinase [Candidatus Omnitrophota bacterium]
MEKIDSRHELDSAIFRLLVHDINNFLGITKGFLDLMRLEKEALPDGVREGLVMAIKAVDDLGNLLSDMNDIAKMEEGKLVLHLEKLDFNDLILGAIEKTSSKAKNSEVSVVFEKKNAPLYADIDKALILRVLIDLITDAIKVSSSGGAVKVACEADENNFKVAVEDFGFSIPPEYREKIFEKYALIEVKDANLKRGYGLNLVFCKLAIQKLGGKIWIESNGQGKGSVFIFTVPRNQKNQPA